MPCMSVPPLRQVNPECAANEDLESVILKALSKDPAQRYPSAAAMIADIRAYVDGTFHVKCMFTLTKRVLREGGRFVDRRPWVAVTLAMVQTSLSLVGVAALVYMIVA